jgi:hypothetical protein
MLLDTTYGLQTDEPDLIPTRITEIALDFYAMKRLLVLFVASVSFVTVTGVAQAQFAPPGDRFRPDAVSALIARVHEDLNRGYGIWRLGHGDRGRLNHAEHQLQDFARHWHGGRFDQRHLDEAIGSIQHVVDSNHLSGRERDALWNDVDELRRMRAAYEHHQIGYR